MKKTAIVFLTLSLCFAADDVSKKVQKILKATRQEVSQMKASLQNMQPSANSHQNQARSSRDPEDLYGTWYNESFDASLYVISGTDQTFPDFMDLLGLEESNGGIEVTGSAEDSLKYMFASFLLEMIEEEGDSTGDGALGAMLIMNVSLMDLFEGEGDSTMDAMVLLLAFSDSAENEVNPDLAVFSTSIDFDETSFFALGEDVSGAVTWDSTDWSVTIDGLTFSNEEGDSSFALSGTIAPDMVELTAGVPTEVPFLEDMDDDEEDWYWVFNEDGTGWEIYIGEDEWGSYSDSSEITWSATDDSLLFVFDDGDSISLAYSIVDDSLFLEGLYYSCEDVPIEECIDDWDLGYLQLLDDIEDIYLMLDLVWSSASLSITDPEAGTLPVEFALHPAYPNPFNPVTYIRFDIGEASMHPTTLRIFDITGRLVGTLMNEQLQTGSYQIQWNAASLASGIYFTELRSGDLRQTGKLVLLK